MLQLAKAFVSLFKSKRRSSKKLSHDALRVIIREEIRNYLSAYYLEPIERHREAERHAERNLRLLKEINQQAGLDWPNIDP